MAERKKVEIGLGVAQVVSARLTDEELARLREAVERGEGWFDLETDDGTLVINLAVVVFLKVAGAPHSVGFRQD
ncbi:MAG TPA: hypothetical protein VFY99_04435 [Solirubrobacterales bacterium]